MTELASAETTLNQERLNPCLEFVQMVHAAISSDSSDDVKRVDGGFPSCLSGASRGYKSDMSIRAAIRDGLGKAGLSARELSQRLGRKHSYISDFLNKGSPVDLSYEDKLMVASVLDINPEVLGIKRIVDPPRVAGLSEDAVAWKPPPGHYLRASPHLAYFRLKGRCLDQHPLRLTPGMLLAFDLNKSNVNEIPSGSVVVAQLYDKRNLTGPTTTVIRQFISPNKLITNSSVVNEIISLDDESLPFEAVIKGTLRSSISADE